MSAGWVLAAVLSAVVETPPAPPPAETFHLDIAERRIHEEGFFASTALRLQSRDGGIAVAAGAAVSARTVDIVLRNVKGTVRFRADGRRLERLTSAAAPSPAVDPEHQ